MATDELKKDYTLKICADISNCLHKYLYDDPNVDTLEMTEILTNAIFLIYKAYLKCVCSSDLKELAEASAYIFLEKLSSLYLDIKGDEK